MRRASGHWMQLSIFSIAAQSQLWFYINIHLCNDLDLTLFLLFHTALYSDGCQELSLYVCRSCGDSGTLCQDMMTDTDVDGQCGCQDGYFYDSTNGTCVGKMNTGKYLCRTRPLNWTVASMSIVWSIYQEICVVKCWQWILCNFCCDNNN